MTDGPLQRSDGNKRGNGDTCVCYVLAYRAPDYIRTRTLLSALNSCAGVRVVRAVNVHVGLWRYTETLRKLWSVRKRERPGIYLLGFRGHDIFWAVKALIGRAPLILDALVSPYAAMHEEMKLGWSGRLIAPLLRAVESAMLHHADLILTDTRSHAGYYAQKFGIDAARIVVVPVGAVEETDSVRASCVRATGKEFSVLFYGSFLGLHGVDVIVDAASRVSDLPVRFDFVGGGLRSERRLLKRCAASKVARFTYRRWVPFAQLLAEDIPSADLLLGGPFGATPQAMRVVTGKTEQSLALGKATVIGKIDEDYGFVDRTNCLLVDQGDANALAQAIRWAYTHRNRLADIGRAGQTLYGEKFSIRVIAERLAAALNTIDAQVRAEA